MLKETTEPRYETSLNINSYTEMIPLFTGPFYYVAIPCQHCEAHFRGFSWEVNDGYDGLGPFCSRKCCEGAIENQNEPRD